MTFVNLTPHPINIVDGDTLLKHEVIPRVSEVEEKIDTINGIDIYKKSYGQVENLPDPVNGTFYIVSAMIALACRDRDDLLIPRTVRDENGRIIGCDGFCKI